MTTPYRQLLADLSSTGFSVRSVSELTDGAHPYKDALPTLLKWLPFVSDLAEKEEIVRALSVRWARPKAALPLILQFRTVDDESGLGLRWVIGNALSIVSDDSVLEEISGLIRSRKYGRSREMLALALAGMKNLQADNLLIEMLDDDQIVGHVLIAIRKRKLASARDRVMKLIGHGNPWIGKEAKKALRALDAGR